jgi:hypothetical protein
MGRFFLVCAGFLWAAPNTAIGLLFLPMALVSGGRARWRAGAVEIHGGLARLFVRHCLRASAFTLGHVIVGQDRDVLDHVRAHEHVHIRQYARWGPFMLPAYFLSSFVAWRRGNHYYFDNRFEREAYGLEP